MRSSSDTEGPRTRKFFSLAGFLSICLPAIFLIAPAALSGPPELRLPPDIVYDKAEGSPGPVVFRHATHFELAENRCTACHPRPFRMLRPERLVTHDEMSAGRSCGLCHDGRKAAAVDDDCGHCHASGKDAK
jgi:c(7)-type cytochrome triheme protein